MTSSWVWHGTWSIWSVCVWRALLSRWHQGCCCPHCPGCPEQQKNVKHPWTAPALILEKKDFFFPGVISRPVSSNNHFTSQVILFYNSVLEKLVYMLGWLRWCLNFNLQWIAGVEFLCYLVSILYYPVGILCNFTGDPSVLLFFSSCQSESHSWS